MFSQLLVEHVKQALRKVDIRRLSIRKDEPRDPTIIVVEHGDLFIGAV